MVRRKQGNNRLQTARTILSMAVETVVSAVGARFQSETELLKNKIAIELAVLQHQIKLMVISLFFLVTATLFVSIAVVFLLIDYAKLPNSVSILLVGMSLFVIGFLYQKPYPLHSQEITSAPITQSITKSKR